MKWSQSYIFTLKEAPADAEIASHQLLVRGGYIRKTAPGIYSFQNLAVRVLRNIEKILREELDKRGCTEVLMPVVHPQELWEETNRWKEMGDGLLKFKNRNGHGFCLGATHEEVVTDIVRKDIRSYRDLPKNLYQIQTKYRDEIRPRFGLMRGREFIMKDGYSFDADLKSALETYDKMYEAYEAIFRRSGLDFRIVDADAGNIGGSKTNEFQVLANAGEDHLMVCDSCNFASNIEVSPSVNKNAKISTEAEKSLETFDTPGLKTIEDLSKSLKVPSNELVKTLFFEGANGEPICVLLRGGDELNPIKLKNVLGLPNPPLLLTDEEVFKLTGAHPGSCGPVGLKCRIFMDTFLTGHKNVVVGANKDGKHLRHVNIGRDFSPTSTVDVRMSSAGDDCPKCSGGKYKSLRGIEVGHVFCLGTKYSKAMGANYLTSDGKLVPLEMGCYGIGVTRTLQAAVEQNHDKDGIIWPYALAPFKVHVCLLDPQSAHLSQFAQQLHDDLEGKGISCLIDDREERPGVKFKDADLLGMPLRVNLGEKGFAANQLELVVRKGKEVIKTGKEALAKEILDWAAKQLN